MPQENQSENVNCYLCDSGDHTAFLTARDDYTGKPGTFTFVRCNQCGLVYQNPRLTIDEVKAFYDDSYIAHRQERFGVLSPLFNWAMSRHDERKIALVKHFAALDSASNVLDIGCAAGGYLRAAGKHFSCNLSGVDFKDFSNHPGFENIDFHFGLFPEQDFGTKRFDLITMWHFLEHDYDPLGSLRYAHELLSERGTLLIEIPCLNSLTYKLYGRYWPGVQAPQHTILFDKKCAAELVKKAGLEITEQLNYGAFPPNFYLFAGLIFSLNQSRGINIKRLLLPYLLFQILVSPFTLFEQRLNICMQTLVCRRPKKQQR